MLIYLFEYLSSFYSGFNVFSYSTVRSILSVLTALLLSLFLGPVFIKWMKSIKAGQKVRKDGPKSHYDKQDTPTMGGSLILFSLSSAVLLWGNLQNQYLVMTFVVTILFGLIGFLDDYLKIKHSSSKGLLARHKYLLQSLVAILAIIYYAHNLENEFITKILIPYMKNTYIELGALAFIMYYFVIVGSCNGVNLTDGLDGLAIMPSILVASALGVFSYASGHFYFAQYLNIPYIAGVAELTIIAAALAGSGLGFLWFNTYPAQVFMGDVGSLAIGACLGTIAILVKQELIFFIMGGIFVIETISVFLQVISYKFRGGKKVFLMAPIHHHFEHKNWEEPKIIVRFWIVTIILVLIGLASLKIR